jgi:hypothetical protein
MAFVLRFDETDPKRQNFAINQLAQGRSNAVGSFTLAASVASTTVTAQNCGSGSFVLLMPKTANAAAEIGNGTLYIGTVANGSFTVTHANNAQTDRSFGYAAFG